MESNTTDIRFALMKAINKFIGKRCGLQQSLALETVSRVSGYRDWPELCGEIQRESAHRKMEYATWSRRLGGERGSNLHLLVTSVELETWYRRIYGAASVDRIASVQGTSLRA